MTQETIKSWGWRIKRAGLTQEKFADKSGVGKHALDSYLRSAKPVMPSAGNFNKIETTLIGLEENG